ncbi:hypothetical protein [Prescottella equi]|uniref:hypothetical protein n=1 Tax=Rhodococcus hoagii TaxID=43767 RepID=UPI000A111D4C|nr:hypothetical protein [Prescottella equi]ORL15419.1 hypothetical protein A6I85_05960 [Prescottella equi]
MTAPGAPRPDGAYVVGSKFGQDVTEASVRGLLKDVSLSGFKDAQNNFWGKFQTFTDGQLLLNQRTDLLSPLLDYGSAYANTSQGIDQTGQVNFTNQIGPMQGCRLQSGRIILQDKGLWDIRCQLWFDYIDILTGDIEWHIRVLRPDGSVFSRTKARVSETRQITSTNICSVVVPDAGYQVQAWIQSIAAMRGILGGPDRNRLTVQHISRNVGTGDTGEGSGT